MNINIPEEVRRGCDELLLSIQKKLKGQLRALVLYGSSARGEIKEGSDIDLYIIADGLPDDRVERSLYLARLVAECGFERKISLRGKRPEELNDILPLYLDIAEDGLILYDPDMLARLFFQKVKKAREEKGLVRYRTPDGYYGWAPLRPLKPGERIELHLKDEAHELRR